MQNTPEYWKYYYEENKEKILTKNRAWSASPQGKEYRKKRYNLHRLEKPDRNCKLCGTPIDKLSARRLFCSQICSERGSTRDYYYRIKADPVRYEKRLAQLRGYRQHTT